MKQGLLPFGARAPVPAPAPTARNAPAIGPPPVSAVHLAARLEQWLGAPVAVQLHRATREPVQVTRFGPAAAPTRFRLRLHKAFASCGDALLEDLAAWTRRGRRAKGASDRIDSFIEDHVRSTRRPPAARPRGDHHDLDALARALAETPDGPRGPLLPRGGETPSLPEFSWSPARRSRARCSIQLGCYDPNLHRVRIHAVLDSPECPPWFLEVLLHHEILHALLPAERAPSGGLLHHGPVFRSWEARHPRRAEALAWERTHIRALLAAARRGQPLPAPTPAPTPFPSR